MELFSEIKAAPFSEIEGLTAEERHLRRRVHAFLSSRVPEFGGVEISVSGPTVALRGKLPSAHAKWLCLECCRRVAGVIKVVDELTVIEEPVPPRSRAVRKRPR